MELGFTDHNDFVKLFSVTGSVPNTPQFYLSLDPGTRRVALLTLVGLRRSTEIIFLTFAGILLHTASSGAVFFPSVNGFS